MAVRGRESEIRSRKLQKEYLPQRGIQEGIKKTGKMKRAIRIQREDG